MVVIEFPIAQYDAFVRRCQRDRTDYRLLSRASMVRRKKEGHFERVMRLECVIAEAVILRALAIRLYPEVVPLIEESLRAARDE